ncbi:hypothetical protein Tco_0833088 [Tanacetum coccineum]
MPSSLSPEPTFGYIDDLDFFKDFENEFPTITYNDLKFKSDPVIEPSVSSQHIDKFETSISKYDEKEQNILHLNNSFPLNVIFLDNPKTIKDNDDSIDLKPLSGNNKINSDAKRSNELPITNHNKTNNVFNEKFFIRTLNANIVNMAPLPHRDLRHPWLRYQVEGYDEGITLADRLGIVYDGEALFTCHAWRRLFEVRGSLVIEFILDFLNTGRMSDTEMGLDVADTLCFQLGGARRMTWRQFILALGLHFEEEMAEAGFGAYWYGSERVIPDKGDLRDYWIGISSNKDFLGPAPFNVHIRDLYLFRHAKGRKSGARLSGDYFIRCLAAHFGIVSDEGLKGLSIVSRELLVIDLHELGRLNICMWSGDTWAWVAPGPERQQATTAGAPGAAKDALAADEGA